ncbi:MAG: heavy-metal-associated domain-containing protein [Actinomycetota bacterium]|nr:heavy-metal-associated domain-containing protein [Actinomycetota bacterium]
MRDLISDCVTKVEGVKSAEFDAKDVALAVKYDSAIVSEDDIRRAILKVGYGFREAEAKPGIASGLLNAVTITGVVLLVLLFLWWMRSL